MSAFADKNFFLALEERIASANSLLCIGLDPHAKELKGEVNAFGALKFCKEIIDATYPYVACYKPNVAFFEAFGAAGISALIEVIRLIPADIPVILDCKRGDIDSTAVAYASSAYDIITPSSISAVTLSPYMGWDSIKPFITGAYENKGAFVLCKTSNQSSRELQSRTLSGGQHVYEATLELCKMWNEEKADKHSRVGVVAGATDLFALERIRLRCPDIWILCPGIGAQGGHCAAACAVGLRQSDASGLLVSVSRGISSAEDKTAAALALRDEVNRCRDTLKSNQKVNNGVKESDGSLKWNKVHLLPYQEQFIDLSINKGALRFGEFKLKSGRLSPYFFNAGLFSCGNSASLLSRCYAQCIHESKIEFDVIFGPAYKGIPLATNVAATYFNMFNISKEYAYNRKEVKDHGEGGLLVGADVMGKKVLVVDDVITAGTAIRETFGVLSKAGASIVAICVSLDREEKPTEAASNSAIQQVEQEFGVPVLSIVKLTHILGFLTSKSETSAAEAAENTRKVDAIRLYRDKYGVSA